MHRFVVVGAGLLSIVATAGAASAADLAARPYTKAPAQVAAINHWSGFCIGLNGGGGWSGKCWGHRNEHPRCAGCPSGVRGLPHGKRCFGRWTNSAIAGKPAHGFLALRASDRANLSGSNGPAPACGRRRLRTGPRSMGSALVTGQVGYAWSNVLFYVKGGAIAAPATGMKASSLRPASFSTRRARRAGAVPLALVLTSE